MLVSKSIPGFYNGVSQQAPSMRLDTQLEAQENMIGTLVDGLGKRPPSEFISVLSGTKMTSESYIHGIYRDSKERYLVVITGDPDTPIEVYGLDGSRKSVSFEEGTKDYLLAGTGSPKARYSVATVADHTFIANREVTCGLLPEVSPGSIADSFSNMTDLPDGDTGTYGKGAFPAVGTVYCLKGNDNNGFSTYYVKYTGGHAYEETIKPGIPYKVNPKTMPHGLVRVGEGAFVFKALAWTDRTTGDEDSAPAPSFVGGKIRRMFFHRNRLGILMEQNIILSAAGDFFRFWPKSALENLDDDPIDIGVGSNSVVSLQAVAEFDKSLLLFSRHEQFIMESGDNYLTPKSVAVTATTAYEVPDNVCPARAGSTVYFASDKDSHVSMREYYVQPENLVPDAADVTAHCPEYVPTGSHQLFSSNVLNTLVYHAEVEPSSLYLYRFYWNGNQKAQSSWSRWTFDGNILGISVFDTEVFYFAARGGQVLLEKVSLDTPRNSGVLQFPVFLDHRITVEGTYNLIDNTTRWTLPYKTEGAATLVSVAEGIEVSTLGNEGDFTITRKGDYSGRPFYAGVKYKSYFGLSEPYFKDQRNGAILADKLQYRAITLSFRDTGYFRVEYTPLYRQTFIRDYTAVIVGMSKLGVVSLMSGEERMLVSGRSKGMSVNIINDSYLPSTFQSASLELTLVRTARVL